MVGQIGFLWGSYGWLGSGGDIRYFLESFRRTLATVSTCIVTTIGIYLFIYVCNDLPCSF